MTWLSFGEKSWHPGSLRVDLRPVADVQADILALPFRDRAFAGVECWHVLEHLLPWDAEAAVAELARVTENGGLLDCTVPDLVALARLVLEGRPDGMHTVYSPHRDPAMRHRWGYTAQTFAELLGRDFEAVRQVLNVGVGWRDEYALHMAGRPRRAA